MAHETPKLAATQPAPASGNGEKSEVSPNQPTNRITRWLKRMVMILSYTAISLAVWLDTVREKVIEGAIAGALLGLIMTLAR
jgi:hypothetical protein